MSRLILLVSSEPVRVRGVLSRIPGVVPAAALVDVPAASEDAPPVAGKTVQLDQGFFIGGEPLVQRGSHEELASYRTLAGLRTDQLLAVVGEPPLSQGVFRYRQFLCAVTGQLGPNPSRAQHTAELPVPLRDNLRGRSEAELFFHQLLGHLHDADPAYLTAAELTAETAAAVLAKALRQAVPDEQGPGVVVALSHGELLVIARRGVCSLRHHSLSEGPGAAASQQLTVAVAEVGSPPLAGDLLAVPPGKALCLTSRSSRPTLISLA
ncbi:MAG: hypothetical protein KA258_02695 [Deltaproteobacteria bacterium]|nr:hypothetical protein [Deltaproteobacteria bacterium]